LRLHARRKIDIGRRGDTRDTTWRIGGMDIKVTRRQFFRVCGSGLAGSSLTMLGFSSQDVMAEVRAFKLLRTTETRSTCPYCSVSCGVIMYTMGDKAKNVKGRIVHIEGDPDHPVNRGTLCPKGAGLLDIIHSPNRLTRPEVREPGSKEWKSISWDDALNRIAKHLKADRDANFVEQNDKGITVNRWNTTGLLVSSASSNESGYLVVKSARAMGMVALDTQARI
jgi:formate dehydrogenase major subunit